MKIVYLYFVILFCGFFNRINAQDTIVLRNQTQVICRVTQVYSARVEYLKTDDTARKQYFSYPKGDVSAIYYANGKRIQLAENALLLSADSAKTAEQQYQTGFQEGYQYYQPNTERAVGASVILLPFIALPGCIYYSFKKVNERDILNHRFQKNTNPDYRSGYLAGASKRRRVAAWSTFGGIVGAGTAIGLLYALGNGQ
ncbi:MAG: hypothetical protein ACK5CL_07720 [Sphingomonadales bacterium]|jgi:hypothetical protein